MKKKFDITIFIIHVFFIILSLIIIIPFVMVVSSSFTDNSALIKNGYKIIPSVFSGKAYQYIFESPKILLRAYGVTIMVTVTGTIIGLLLTAMTGYVMSRKDYKFSKFLSIFILFTMLFHGGLVASYIINTSWYKLGNNVMALVVLNMLNPFYILIMKGFMAKMSTEIVEAAKIDGASEWPIFLRIILPLAKPVMGTLGLFIAFNYWNEWFSALLYIDNDKLIPIQLLLVRMMRSVEFLSQNSQFVGSLSIDRSKFPSETVRMAMTVLAIGPMMFIFPFFQKYFVSGLTLGSIKG